MLIRITTPAKTPLSCVIRMRSVPIPVNVININAAVKSDSKEMVNLITVQKSIPVQQYRHRVTNGLIVLRPVRVLTDVNVVAVMMETV